LASLGGAEAARRCDLSRQTEFAFAQMPKRQMPNQQVQAIPIDMLCLVSDKQSRSAGKESVLQRRRQNDTMEARHGRVSCGIARGIAVDRSHYLTEKQLIKKNIMSHP
jgi:hypothetical protein